MFPFSVNWNFYKIMIQYVIGKFVGLLLISHIISCIWVREYQIQLGDIYTDYINGLYAFITTASTAGYGDLTVATLETTEVGPQDAAVVISRYLFGIFLLAFAVLFFAYTKAIMDWVIEEYSKLQSQSKTNMVHLTDWLAARSIKIPGGVPFSYERTAKTYFNSFWTKDFAPALNLKGYYDKIGSVEQECVRASVCYSIHSLSKSFSELDVDNIIGMKGRYTVQLKNDIILDIGEWSEYLQIIINGTISTFDKQNRMICEFGKGDLIGEESILRNRSKFRFKCNSKVTLFRIHTSTVIKYIQASNHHNLYNKIHCLYQSKVELLFRCKEVMNMIDSEGIPERSMSLSKLNQEHDWELDSKPKVASAESIDDDEPGSINLLYLEHYQHQMKLNDPSHLMNTSEEGSDKQDDEEFGDDSIDVNDDILGFAFEPWETLSYEELEEINRMKVEICEKKFERLKKHTLNDLAFMHRQLLFFLKKFSQFQVENLLKRSMF